MKTYAIIFLILVLVFITYFTDFFFARTGNQNENEALRQENQDLLAQIQRYSLPGFKQSDLGQKSLKARVFSVYPFNVKNLITIDVGENAGIKNSKAVILGDSILVGVIKDVFKETSTVETIFDPNLQLPVRIGEGQVDGLLQGGSEPKIILVEKSREVNVGDLVYSAGATFPYGLKVGEVSEINENSAGVFKEIILKAPFNVSELREVGVVLDN